MVKQTLIFLPFVLYSVFVILLKELKTLRVVAHSVHGRPYGEVVNKSDEVTRTTNRRDVDRSKHIGVHKVENCRSAGGSRLWKRSLVTFPIDAANADVATLLVTRQVHSFDHPSLDHR